MSVTFFDEYFSAFKHRPISPKPQQRRSEYHGVATAVGKISKRLHNIEEALREAAEKTPLPRPRKTPIPTPVIADDIPTKPITPPVVAPATVTVDTPKEVTLVQNT